MVIMASGTARGRVRATTTTATGVAQHSGNTPNVGLQPWFTVYFFDIGHPCYDQKDTCQNKVSADQYHVTISQAQVYSSSRSGVF